MNGPFVQVQCGFLIALLKQIEATAQPSASKLTRHSKRDR
jgi:hypothetical protein